MSSQASVGTQPFLLMIAGPNGSGKTTLTRFLRSKNVDFGYYINADDLAQRIGRGSYEARTRKAQQLAERQRLSCIALRRSFSFETVMSHRSKLDVLDTAREAEFSVQMFFVGTDDPRINVDRVIARVKAGGHDVPHDKIIARWHRTMNFLAEAIYKCDRVVIFDNSRIDCEALGPVFEWKMGNGQLIGDNPNSIPRWIQQYVLQPLEINT